MDVDLHLPSGRLRARRWGADGAPLLLCVHGISANLTGWAWLAERLASRERQVVALDLRGRGRSDVTPPGSYGIDSHARDVLDAAAALGADEFDVAGWSMGALISIRVAGLDAARVHKLALIDHAGRADDAAIDAVKAGFARLDRVAPTPEAYIEPIRAAGAIDPWSPFWDAYYRYELEQQPDGSWRPTTNRAACEEDLEKIGRIDWSPLTMPVALIRAKRPLGAGHVLPEATRDEFLATVPQATLTEVDAGHFTVMTDDGTLGAIAELLER